MNDNFQDREDAYLKFKEEMQNVEDIVVLLKNSNRLNIFKKFELKRLENQDLDSAFKVHPEIITASKEKFFNYTSFTTLDLAVVFGNKDLVSFLMDKGQNSFKTAHAANRALNFALLTNNQDLSLHLYHKYYDRIDFHDFKNIDPHLGNNLLSSSFLNYLEQPNLNSLTLLNEISSKFNSGVLTNKVRVILKIESISLYDKNTLLENLTKLKNLATIALNNNLEPEIHRAIGKKLTNNSFYQKLNPEEFKQIHEIAKLYNTILHGQDENYCKEISKKLSDLSLSSTNIIATKDSLKNKLNQSEELYSGKPILK